MELKASLKKPFTDEERIDFMFSQNNNVGYSFKETSEALEVWCYTEQEKQEQERRRLDALTLTPSDVERALMHAREMDFEDLRSLIVQEIPSISIKGLAVEFRANNFYRGASYNGVRLFDAIGELLGYTSEDMDYLFEHKALPEN